MRVDDLSYFSLCPWSNIVLGTPRTLQMLVEGMKERTPITEERQWNKERDKAYFFLSVNFLLLL